MALSGSSSAYYTGTNNMDAAWLLGYAATYSYWVQASSVPSTANFKTVAGHRSVSGSDPHDNFNWNHTSASFKRSFSHKYAGSYYPAQLTADPSLNTWVHFASVFDGANAKIYESGSLNATSASCGTGGAVGGPFGILAGINGDGSLDSSSQFDIGQIAEIGIWNVALSADEIGSLAKGFRPPRVRPQSLKQYWPAMRELIEVMASNTLVKKQGTTVVTDHPRVIG